MNRIYNFQGFNESLTNIPYVKGTVLEKSYTNRRIRSEYYEIVDIISKTDNYIEYSAFQLKSSLTEVKTPKITTIKVGLLPSTNVKYSVVKVNDVLVSKDYIEHSNIDAELVNLGNDVPPHLLTLEQYKNTIGSLFKKLEKLAKTYNNQIRFSYNSYNVPLTKEESLAVNKYSDVRDMEAPTPEVITERDTIIKSLNGLLYTDVRLIKSDVKRDNKYFINNALKNGVYEDLLLSGKITIKNIDQIFNSVKLKVPAKLVVASKKYTIDGITKEKIDDINTQKERNFNTLVDLFNDVYETKRKGFIDFYTKIYDKLNEFLKTYTFTDIDKFKYDYYVYLYKEKPPVDNKNKYIYNTEYIINFTDIKGIIKYTKDAFILVDNYNDLILENGKLYADGLFKLFNERLTQKLLLIDNKELPIIKGGTLFGHTTKSFESVINLEYKNGFSFMVETEVIIAGGYNIQTEHLRGLFKFKYNGKVVSLDVIMAEKIK